MARGVNKVILIGNLGRDPEVRYTAAGAAIANCTLATGMAWKDKQTGEMQEQTEWHRIVMYQRLAEVARDHLHKGSKIYVEGRLQTRKWQDKNTGQDRYTTEIVVESLEMLDNKSSHIQDTAPFSTPTSSSSTTANTSLTDAALETAVEDHNDIPF